MNLLFLFYSFFSVIFKDQKLLIKEQSKIARLGLEMKLIQNEIEAEADKWNEPHNEIVKVEIKSNFILSTFCILL